MRKALRRENFSIRNCLLGVLTTSVAPGAILRSFKDARGTTVTYNSRNYQLTYSSNKQTLRSFVMNPELRQQCLKIRDRMGVEQNLPRLLLRPQAKSLLLP